MQNDTSNKPSFFIIGAPKSGTTALRQYLREHPDIFIPKGEINFFSKDVSSSTDYRNLEEYLQAFASAPQGSVIGEKSVWYLYSKVAVPNILKLNPGAKFIVMLRNPIEMAPSLYAQTCRGAQENTRDFQDAWYAQEDRKNGKRIPKGSPPEKLQYGEICKLGEQLERVYSLVSKDRLHVIFLEDLKEDALNVYKDTLQFLGVPYDGRTVFPVVNQNKVVTRPRLLRFLYAVQRLKKKLPIPSLNLHVLARLKEKSRAAAPRTPIPGTLKQELADYFREDIRKLGCLTGRDLSPWFK